MSKNNKQWLCLGKYNHCLADIKYKIMETLLYFIKILNDNVL